VVVKLDRACVFLALRSNATYVQCGSREDILSKRTDARFIPRKRTSMNLIAPNWPTAALDNEVHHNLRGANSHIAHHAPRTIRTPTAM